MSKTETTSEKLLPTSDEIIDAHNHNVIRHIYLETIKKLLKQDNIDDAYKALDMYAAKVNTRILRKPDPKDVELVREALEEIRQQVDNDYPEDLAGYPSIKRKRILGIQCYEKYVAAFNRIVGE